MKMKRKEHFIYGLVPKKRDKKTFKHYVAFGAVPKAELPTEDFEFPILGIKDQDGTDFCAGAASCAASEVQEDVKLSMSFSIAAGKSISGDINGYGCGLIDMAKAHTKIGALPEESVPEKFLPLEQNRSLIVDIKNWDDSLRLGAATFKKQSYFDVSEGPYDLFDNVRSGLWKNYKAWKSGAMKPQPCFSGLAWHFDWNNIQGGIIPKTYGSDFGYHSIAIVGQRLIDGEIYLKIQNSYGPSMGDNGFWYIPREVFNREIKFKKGFFWDHFEAICFNDLPRDFAQIAAEQNILDLLYEKFLKLYNYLKSIGK